MQFLRNAPKLLSEQVLRDCPSQVNLQSTSIFSQKQCTYKIKEVWNKNAHENTCFTEASLQLIDTDKATYTTLKAL